MAVEGTSENHVLLTKPKAQSPKPKAQRPETIVELKECRNVHMRFRYVGMATVAVLLQGCGSGGQTQEEKDRQAEEYAKSFGVDAQVSTSADDTKSIAIDRTSVRPTPKDRPSPGPHHRPEGELVAQNADLGPSSRPAPPE